MLCCSALSFVHNRCLPVHVHVCPLLFFEATSSILEMASTVGLPVGAIWVAPSHDHVIVATGFPPPMVHARVTLLPSIIGPTGTCAIVGNVVGWSKRLKFILKKTCDDNILDHLLKQRNNYI